MSFQMNSPAGKQVLAMLRDGDYAHPGENTAIAEALSPVRRTEVRRVLDAGCGRGGTAHWLRQNGWGTVVGLDIDAESVAYASTKYPEVRFYAMDVARAGELPEEPFDLVCCFNTYYAFPDQPAALRSLRKACRPGASLVLFDYSRIANQPLPVSLGDEIGHPINLSRIEEELRESGWQLAEVNDISERYVLWYESLLSRLRANRSAIVAVAGEEMCQYVADWYGELYRGLAARTIGGALIIAVAH
jgi:SAM-dependent methyltransferase